MSLTAAEQEILTAANEDWCGLWEVVWAFRGLFPNSSDQEIRATAKRALRSMLDRSYIYLCRLEPPKNLESRISSGEIDAVLSDQENWEPPPTVHSVYVAFAATEEGERAWRGG